MLLLCTTRCSSSCAPAAELASRICCRRALSSSAFRLEGIVDVMSCVQRAMVSIVQTGGLRVQTFNARSASFLTNHAVHFWMRLLSFLSASKSNIRDRGSWTSESRNVPSTNRDHVSTSFGSSPLFWYSLHKTPMCRVLMRSGSTSERTTELGWSMSAFRSGSFSIETCNFARTVSTT